VDGIFNWLVHRSVRGAISWYLAFGRAVEKIAASPEIFAEAPESRPLARQLRQALFKTRRGRIYRIVFELSDAEIILLRVRGPGQPRLRRRELPSE
jgi:plasmid stabilization system protein ParE